MRLPPSDPGAGRRSGTGPSGSPRSAARFEAIGELPIDRAQALVYELGWQTCSPSLAYRATERPFRPTSQRNLFIGYRPGHPAPEDAFQGEGLLAVRPAEGEPVHVFGIADARDGVASIRARLDGSRLRIEADGAVEHRVEAVPAAPADAPDARSDGSSALEGAPPPAIDIALARWADRFGDRMAARTVTATPAIWCSWYRYFDGVTEADIAENADAIDRLELPVDVVQLDDGWQRCVGDWEPSARFGSLEGVVAAAAAIGRRAGIWLAPFLVRARSELARRHPGWLVRGEDGPIWIGRNWDDDLFALDSTIPEAWEPVLDALHRLRSIGFELFKLDFLYAGAVEGLRREEMPSVAAYRAAMDSIRDVIGPGAYVLGAGPLLASAGLVDGMRIAPDIALQREPDEGDMSQPSVETAMRTSRGRAFLHGRLFANDADCLIARPAFGERERWLDHLRHWGGLRGCSDRLDELDGWGLEATRAWLSGPVPERLIDP